MRTSGGVNRVGRVGVAAARAGRLGTGPLGVADAVAVLDTGRGGETVVRLLVERDIPYIGSNRPGIDAAAGSGTPAVDVGNPKVGRSRVEAAGGVRGGAEPPCLA